MAYDAKLAGRIEAIIDTWPAISNLKMFGGLCYLNRDHMFAGIVKDDLMIRVGPEKYEQALSRKHARPMDFTGKPMKGYLFVAPEGLKTRPALEAWLKAGYDFTLELPPKKPKKKKPPRLKK